MKQDLKPTRTRRYVVKRFITETYEVVAKNKQDALWLVGFCGNPVSVEMNKETIKYDGKL